MRLKIQYKIILIISVILSLALLAIFFYLQPQLKNHTFERIRSNLIREITFSKAYFEKVYRNNTSIKNIDRIADEIGQNLSLRVTVIGSDGKVLGDSHLSPSEIGEVDNHLYRPEIQQAFKSNFGESRRFSNTIREELLYIAVPILIGEQRGVIRFALPLAEIKEVSDNLKHIIVIALLIALFVSVLLSFIVSNIVSRPITEISTIAKEIADGDFSRTARVSSNDEISDLADSINYMSDQIKNKIDEVLTSKSRLEAVFLSMVEGVMVVDSNGFILLMNEAIKNLLHVEEEYSGKKSLEVIRNIEIQEMVDKILHQSQGVETREITVLLPEEKVLLVHATPVVRENNIEGAVLVFHDISELRRLENIRKDFVANVSHELRTPITSIKGYAETLLEGAIDDKENAKDFLQIISTDSDRLAKLVEDILDLSKIESGKTQFNYSSCNISELVSRVAAGLQRQFKIKKVMFKNDIPISFPKIVVDETGLAQVFLNIIENALKYNKEDGSITVSAKDDGEFVQIEVKDTGIGIPQEDISRIFERFYRVDKAHSRQMGGTGLGLSIVKHIIQAHQGEVNVRSIYGEGTTFIFKLPKNQVI